MDPVNGMMAVAVRHHRSGDLAEAERLYRLALQRDPGDPDALQLLGLANSELGRASIGAAMIKAAIARKPDDARLHNNLGTVLCSQGLVPEAIASFRRALAMAPDYALAHSNLLVTLHYLSSYRPEELAAEGRLWGRQHAAHLESRWRPFPNAPHPERRLRLGYVSGELRRHPVGYFLESVLAAHDRSHVEVFCYANSAREDDLTARLRAAADHWRAITDASDEEAAETIRDDQIDVLIDLSGHLGSHRLLVFARKPAPVLASWIGYFDTSGVPAMDYLIADRYVCPEEEDGRYVEQVVRLPDAFLCYTPPRDAPAVAPPPTLSRGGVTFASFNRIAKVTPDVAALWAEIVRAVPGSRLCLKAGDLADGATAARYARLFAAHGLGPDRLELRGPSPHAELLASYADVDVALDPFPYSGSTTTIEALWMGVPVVALEGDRFSARTSRTILANAGLPELVASSPADYAAKAVALAADPARLTSLRAGLRARVARSPLCDAPRLARSLEAALREMWQRWCRCERQARAQ
jgi:predicted O-linked N-acetylglucosamine transferase (SPINDLY family)